MITYPTASVFPPLPLGGTHLSALQQEVIALKKAKDALILAHNYQCEDIQGVADYVGDSVGLAYKAAEAKQSTIVFCGVHFMAETAKIVNPTRRVLLPDLAAGCSLADSCPAEKLAAAKAKDPSLYVVAYINCSAAVKALCDVIVTSGNASKIVSRVPADRNILFVPDQNLAGDCLGTIIEQGHRLPRYRLRNGVGIHRRSGCGQHQGGHGDGGQQSAEKRETEVG